MQIEKKPWSYMDRVRGLLPQATALLDLGTGGGEKLLSLQADWPPKVAVTEGYHPNFLLAKERLEPLGVQVVESEADMKRPLPFPNAAEVARVLKPGGTFLTKQVNGRWFVEDFSVATHLEQLKTLQAQLERGESLSFFAGYFMLQARKKGA